MFYICVPTLDELLARIDGSPEMSATQLISALGAKEAKDFFRQLRQQLAEEEADPTTK